MQDYSKQIDDSRYRLKMCETAAFLNYTLTDAVHLERENHLCDDWRQVIHSIYIGSLCHNRWNKPPLFVLYKGTSNGWIEKNLQERWTCFNALRIISMTFSTWFFSQENNYAVKVSLFESDNVKIKHTTKHRWSTTKECMLQLAIPLRGNLRSRSSLHSN